MGEKDQSKNTEKEEKLLQLIRELKFGEIHIYVADGQPVRAEEIKNSVKLLGGNGSESTPYIITK